MTEHLPRVAIIGAGPAGLMAAEILSDAGYAVSLYEAMPSPARKFLMAGKSGLNITNMREGENFISHYPDVAPVLKSALSEFGPATIAEWMQGLGVEATIGPTGRVFPVQMKASPLLRVWLARLQSQGVQLHTRHRWAGWSDDADLIFDTPEGAISVQSDAQIFALGGGSWKRLGSDGGWSSVFTERGIQTEPFRPSNCGFTVDWSDRMRTEFVGTPVKNVAVRFGGQTSREEFVVTDRGVESGAIFTLSLAIRDRLKTDGQAILEIDLAPDLAEATLASRLKLDRGKQSLSNHLRKVANLKGVKRALLFEFGGLDASNEPERLARLIKCLPIPLEKPFPLDEAISTAGGVSFDALDDHCMVKQQPGMFCAGEMLDWDAPTGGYLLTACMATGRAAGLGAVRWLRSQV
ncbi:MAG: aminoacetone oxidase family FAD-binding enzyme [Hyphomonadaceae bacterium]|nr:aminoacetone oxidase family FAD-binding enzyme [Hyphomonadaceae bacterium]